MKPESARALVWIASILIVLGLMVMSPAGALALFVLAALCAAFPLTLGPKRPRIAAAVLFFCALVLAAAYYPDFSREQKTYTLRAKQHPVQTPPNPQEVIKP